MITAVEGQYIYNYILLENKEKWFADKLLQKRQTQNVNLTTNGFARMCLEKNAEHTELEQLQRKEICPFLEEKCCTLYGVRPFSCRSFASTKYCNDYGSAHLNERLLVINTVTMQLIEHLGQKGYWGNMLDVLLALAHHKVNEAVKTHISDDERVQSAIRNTLTAEPIPGFLLRQEEENEVNQYLQTVLSAKIGIKTIEEIFNNK
ncbi:MAG: hypothetical protein KKA54_13610 [Proteobacteria bacterium]|nr:hypothetical protein [Pseudomonadota bacterium]